MTQLKQVAWRFTCVGSDSDAVLPCNRRGLHWCPAWLLVKTWTTSSCDTGCTHPHGASSLADAWREDLNPFSEKHRIRAWQVNLAVQANPPHSLLPLCSYPALSRCCCRATALCPVVGSLVEPNAGSVPHFPAPPCWGAGGLSCGTCPSSAPPTPKHWSLCICSQHCPSSQAWQHAPDGHQKLLLLHSVLPSHVLPPQRGHVIHMALDSYTHPDTHRVFSMVASLSFHASLNISVSRFTSYCSGKIRVWVGKAETTVDVDWHGRVSII